LFPKISQLFLKPSLYRQKEASAPNTSPSQEIIKPFTGPNTITFAPVTIIEGIMPAMAISILISILAIIPYEPQLLI
jgi:hypothetical protein